MRADRDPHARSTAPACSAGPRGHSLVTPRWGCRTQFQKRERTESGARGEGVGALQQSPPATATAPSIRCPGLAGRPRLHAAHPRARRVGSSTVNPGRYLDSRAVTQTLTHPQDTSGFPNTALQRQFRDYLGLAPQRRSGQPSRPCLWPRHRLPNSPSSVVAQALQTPLNAKCVLTPTHAHANTHQQTAAPNPHRLTRLFSK